MNEQLENNEEQKDPGTIEVSATSPKTSQAVELTLNFGNSLEEMRAELGDETTFDLAKRMIRTDASNRCRAWLDKGESEDSVIERIQSWTPGVSAPRTPQDPLAYFRKNKEKMTDEQRQALIAELQQAG